MMANAQNRDSLALLATIPDWSDWTHLERWAQGTLDKVPQLLSEKVFNFSSIEGASIVDLCPVSLFGRFASPAWRKFATAIFLADLACYTTSVDQVNFERLLFVLHTFPLGFRVWGIQVSSEEWLPVGYSAWYPVAEPTFGQLERADPLLASRLVAPLSTVEHGRSLVYLFNYSIAAPFRKAQYSKTLLAHLTEDIQKCSPKGLAAITVSSDGIRIAERLGLRITGSLLFDGLPESILTVRL